MFAREVQRVSFISKNKLIRIFTVFVLITGLAGCHSFFVPRHFEGVLVESIENDGSTRKLVPTKKRVSIDLEFSSARAGTLKVTDVQKNLLMSIEFSHLSTKGLDLVIPAIRTKPFPLWKKVKYDDGLRCFLGDSEFNVKFCVSEQEFQLTLSDPEKGALPFYTLIGWRLGKDRNFEFEKPSDFTLQQALNMIAEQNFGSRIEFERQYQSKEKVIAAYLNLLPHFSVKGVIGGTVGVQAAIGGVVNPIAIMNAAGDFIPFLFPSRWIQASKAESAYEAQKIAYKVMRADLTAQMEGFVYGLMNQEKAFSIYRMLIDKGNLILPKMKLLEQNGKLNSGAADALITVLKDFEIKLGEMGASIVISKAALSETLGFLNPQSVKTVSFGDAPDPYPIENARPLDFEKVLATILGRSLEIRQIDFLIESISKEKVELFFHWMDPSGNPNFGLGLNLIPQYKIAVSQKREMELKQDQIQRQMMKKAGPLVRRHNLNLNQYQRSLEQLQIQTRRFDSTLELIHSAHLEDMALSKLDLRGIEIQQIFQDFADAALSVENYLAWHRVARSQLDRLLLIGHYQGFMWKQDQSDLLDALVVDSTQHRTVSFSEVIFLDSDLASEGAI